MLSFKQLIQTIINNCVISEYDIWNPSHVHIEWVINECKKQGYDTMFVSQFLSDQSYIPCGSNTSYHDTITLYDVYNSQGDMIHLQGITYWHGGINSGNTMYDVHILHS